MVLESYAINRRRSHLRNCRITFSSVRSFVAYVTFSTSHKLGALSEIITLMIFFHFSMEYLVVVSLPKNH